MDVSRLTPFFGAESLSKNQAIAAADLGETAVTSIIGVRGDPKVRKSLTFQVLWTDGEETWEPGESVKRLTALDDFIAANPRSGLAYLRSRS